MITIYITKAHSFIMNKKHLWLGVIRRINICIIVLHTSGINIIHNIFFHHLPQTAYHSFSSLRTTYTFSRHLNTYTRGFAKYGHKIRVSLKYMMKVGIKCSVLIVSYIFIDTLSAFHLNAYTCT